MRAPPPPPASRGSQASVRIQTTPLRFRVVDFSSTVVLGRAAEGTKERDMRARLIASVAVVAMAVPVASAYAHPADYMYTPGGEYVREIGNPDDGVGTFLQREVDTP